MVLFFEPTFSLILAHNRGQKGTLKHFLIGKALS